MNASLSDVIDARMQLELGEVQAPVDHNDPVWPYSLPDLVAEVVGT